MSPIGDKARDLCRHLFVPLFLLVCAPPATLLVWAINVRYDGSVLAFAEQALAVGFLSELASIWGPYVWGTAAGWKIIGVFAALQLFLMRLVPGKSFHGPVTPNGHVPEYRANGVACFLITIGLFLGGSYGLDWFDPAIVYDNFPGILGALNVFGLSLCLLLYIKGRRFPSGPDHGVSGNFLFDYYWGTELYPRILGWDVKVFTNCRFGMTGWAVIVLSFAAKHVELNGSMSESMIVALVIMMAYLVKFFIWETGYLCTKDIMHDRAGFMICWGCLVWVPAIYTSPILYLVHHPHQLGLAWSVAITLLGLSAVAVNYLTDRQRQIVRATGGDCTVWGRRPRCIEVTYRMEDGEERKTLLLASGWWGVARHFRYTPELLAAFLWSVPALFDHFIPYFYVSFLMILLLHRALRDEEHCRNKYGEGWHEYRRLVPSYILPGLRFQGVTIRGSRSR